MRAAAVCCGVAETTSFRWRHRFLANLAELKATSLTGIVEAGETYFPLSFKGSRQMPRLPRRRGHAIHQRGTRGASKCQYWFYAIAMERPPTLNYYQPLKAEEAPILAHVVALDAVLCTDGSGSFKCAARQAGIAHRVLNLSAGVHVLAGVYHIQNVNAYDSRLKNWMIRFHGIATKYLENYRAGDED
ncbi:MAG: IS1595 family transposase [Methylococcales bacterium]